MMKKSARGTGVDAAMGIRPKILWTFIICFGLMAGISLSLLHHSLNQSYDGIERRDLGAHMGRVVQSLESGLGHLHSQTRDWAVWTEMYHYVQTPSASWADENIGAHAMEPADLSLVMVYDAQGELVSMTTRNRGGGTLDLPTLQSGPYAQWLKESEKETTCGLLDTDVGLMLTCRANITRSDTSGAYVGTVVMGRQLDTQRSRKLQVQTRLSFQLHDRQDLPAGLVRWPGLLTPGPLGMGDFWTAHDETLYHLYYPLQDVLKKNVGLITLDVSRDVHEEAEKVFSQVRTQMVWTAWVTAILLTVAVHLLLVRRLRRFTRQLVHLTEQSTWHTRISVRGNDELALLSRQVNSLLAVIESQVQTLEALTVTDPLTGLTNRRAFDARLALEYARKNRDERPLAMLMLDVDYFKRYNDRYGHPGGDSALQALAQVLRLSVCHASDLVVRLGGEEFAILAPETDAAGATALAERIRTNLRERCIAHADSPVAAHMTVSIGIVIAGDETPEAFVNRADQALYKAKHGGRDRAYCDEPGV